MKWPYSLKLAAASAAVLLFSNSAEAQFTYATGGLSARFIPFDWDIAGEDNTTARSLSLTVGAVHRPIRKLAVGLEFDIPVMRGTNFSYKDAENRGTSFPFDDFEFRTGGSSNYVPQEYDYTLSNNIHTRFLLRYYPANSLEEGTFIEGRAALGTLKEEFTFIRTEIPGSFIQGTPTVPGENVNYSNDRSAGSLGLAFGSFQQFNSGFYYDFRFGYDHYFYDIEGDDFLYVIVTDRESTGGGNIETEFRSRIRENNGSWFAQLSFGYFF